jgi:1-hydroxycarotenoid 3,4-desaturase
VFFHADYKSEFDDIADGRLPGRGTVYISAQDRADDARLPVGCDNERLLALVNAPAIGDVRGDAQGAARQALDATEIESCEQTSFALLRRCGLTLTPQAQVVTTPSEFHRLFPGTGGAIYGRGFSDRMTGGWMTLFKRPGAASPVPGLYLAGGSVHPGAGVPMVALSGMIAARAAEADLPSAISVSRAPSRRAAMPGGISTR